MFGRLETAPSTAAPPTPASTRWRRAGWLSALALLVVGMRFWLVYRYGRAMPFWDQWDAEGAVVLKPWLDGTLDWRTLFAPHNEHRLVLTRLLALGLCAVNGQWDARLEATCNALFCTAGVVGLAAVLLAAFRGRYPRAILLAVATCFAVPFGWENTIGGFQSQYFFLLFFSLLTVWGLGTGRPGSARWWAGAAGAVLACLSMASGFLAAAAALGLCGLRLLAVRRRPGRGEWTTASLCGVLVAVGWFSRTLVPGHAALQAGSPLVLLRTMCHYLAWPHPGYPWLTALTMLPLGLLTWRTNARLWQGPATEDDQRHGRDLLLLGLGGWVCLQIAALAYGRGGTGEPPADRYSDLLALLSLTGFLAWLALLAESKRSVKGWLLVATALWVAVFCHGLWQETSYGLREAAPEFGRRLRSGEETARGYVATHDAAHFLGGPPVDTLSYPDPIRLAEWLDDPKLRTVLPAEVRAPLAVEPLPADGAPAGFVPGGYDPAIGPPPIGTAWGSRAPGGDGTFRARLVPAPTLPFLQFFFAGGPAHGNLGFRLRDARSGHGEAARLGGKHSRDWSPQRFHMTGPSLTLEATDRDPARWLAFAAPVEMGGWSFVAQYILRRYDWLLAGAAVLLALTELSSLPAALGRWRTGSDAPTMFPTPGAAPLRLLSVVIPARDEEGCIAATVEGLHAELRRAGVPHEIVVVDDGSTDATWERLQRLGAGMAELRPVANPGPHGFGRAIIHGLDHMRGDAVVIAMADESDAPADAVRYWRTLQEGYGCVFGSRFVRGGGTERYPLTKLVLNRLANRSVQALFDLGLNDTTNAFKAYRREVIDGCRPLVSAGFHLTVELPLKAVTRGYSWAVVPVTWRNRRAGVAKFRFWQMGGRYLLVCLHVWLEQRLRRGSRPGDGFGSDDPRATCSLAAIRMNDSTSKVPLRAGLAAARANLVPGLIIQATMLALVLAYFFHPPTRGALDVLAAWKGRGGLAFTFVLLGIAGGVLPEVFQVAIFQRGVVSRANWHNALFAFPLWGAQGCVTDLFYRAQAVLFGHEATVAVIVKKVLFDMFVYTPLWGTPVVVCAYEWRRHGFSGRWREIFPPGFYRDTVFPTLVANWGVWIPAVSIIYALPLLLQVPLFALATSFWALLVAYLARQERLPIGPPV